MRIDLQADSKKTLNQTSLTIVKLAFFQTLIHIEYAFKVHGLSFEYFRAYRPEKDRLLILPDLILEFTMIIDPVS